MTGRMAQGLLATVPALLFGSLAFIAFEPAAYYSRLWQIAAVVFIAGSLLLGFIVAGRREAVGGDAAARNRLLFCGAVAWGLAVATLFALSVTPLCVGQDNGDGANGYPECVFFAVLSSLVYSSAVLPVVFVSSWLLALPFRRAVSSHRPQVDP
jgi:hypothetical protein